MSASSSHGKYTYTFTFADGVTRDVTSQGMDSARQRLGQNLPHAHGGVVGCVRKDSGFEVVKTGLSKADEKWLAEYMG